jgi:predicted transcriptional regulator
MTTCFKQAREDAPPPGRIAMLSLKPAHAELILDGSKRWEYRKRPVPNLAEIVIYASLPVGMVLGSVRVEATLAGSPDEIWEATGSEGGIDRAAYDEYFRPRMKGRAYAFRLGRATRFPRPRRLAHYGVRHAPQSFMYVDGLPPDAE